MNSSQKYGPISSPPIYTTRNGGRYVRPFDILRSDAGRATIERYANGGNGTGPEPANESQLADDDISNPESIAKS